MTVTRDQSTAVLLTRLEDALALYDEQAWRDLRQILVSEGRPASVDDTSKQWFEIDPDRLAKERAVLTELLSPLPDNSSLFFQQSDTNRIGATGLLRWQPRENLKVEILFPDGYPDAPPRVFFFGHALRKIPQLLREDGSIPVPSGAEQQWSSRMTSAVVLEWATGWLEKTVRLEAPSSGEDSTGGRPSP